MMNSDTDNKRDNIDIIIKEMARVKETSRGEDWISNWFCNLDAEKRKEIAKAWCDMIPQDVLDVIGVKLMVSGFSDTLESRIKWHGGSKGLIGEHNEQNG